jgi:hypothetical protein
VVAYDILTGKPEKIQLRRPMCRWKYSIKMARRKIDFGDLIGFI